MKSSFVAASILLLSAASAQAADLFIPMEPAPAPVYVDDLYDWSGVYFGVHLGGQAVNFTNAPISNGSGYLAGGFVGANLQDGNFVYGVEGDLEYSSFRVFEGIGGTDYDGEHLIDYQGSLRARFGYAVDTLLFYGTAGLALAHLETGSYVDNGGDFRGGSDGIRYGWTVGAGAEAALTDNLIARVEYRYTDLGVQDQLYGDPTDDVGVTTHALRAGVSFKF